MKIEFQEVELEIVNKTVQVRFVLDLFNKLKALDGKFSHTMNTMIFANAKNMSSILYEFIKLKNEIDNNVEFVEYRSRLNSVIRQYCLKNESDQPIKNEKGEIVFQDKESAELCGYKCSDVDNEFKHVKEDLETKEKQLNDVLNKEIVAGFYMLTYNELRNEKLRKEHFPLVVDFFSVSDFERIKSLEVDIND